MSRLTRDGTAEPVSRDQILRHARGEGNVHFPCSADHEQDWQPYPVDPYSAICDDHTYIHICTYFHLSLCGVIGGRNAGVDPVRTSPFFVCFFLHPIKGHLQFFYTFFSATEFPHFCVFIFYVLPFAMKNGLSLIFYYQGH